MIIHISETKDCIIDVYSVAKAPVHTTLTEVGFDISCITDHSCIVWIDSESGVITATTYEDDEMTSAEIEVTDQEQRFLNHFAQDLFEGGEK